MKHHFEMNELKAEKTRSDKEKIVKQEMAEKIDKIQCGIETANKEV